MEWGNFGLVNRYNGMRQFWSLVKLLENCFPGGLWQKIRKNVPKELSSCSSFSPIVVNRYKSKVEKCFIARLWQKNTEDDVPRELRSCSSFSPILVLCLLHCVLSMKMQILCIVVWELCLRGAWSWDVYGWTLLWTIGCKIDRSFITRHPILPLHRCFPWRYKTWIFKE